jgi:hypothetical protein
MIHHQTLSFALALEYGAGAFVALAVLLILGTLVLTKVKPGLFGPDKEQLNRLEAIRKRTEQAKLDFIRDVARSKFNGGAPLVTIEGYAPVAEQSTQDEIDSIIIPTIE